MCEDGRLPSRLMQLFTQPLSGIWTWSYVWMWVFQCGVYTVNVCAPSGCLCQHLASMQHANCYMLGPMQGHNILDLRFENTLVLVSEEAAYSEIASEIESVPGVVTHGLLLGAAQDVVVARRQGGPLLQGLPHQ